MNLIFIIALVVVGSVAESLVAILNFQVDQKSDKHWIERHFIIKKNIGITEFTPNKKLSNLTCQRHTVLICPAFSLEDI